MKLKGVSITSLFVCLLLAAIGVFLLFVAWRPVSLPFIGGQMRQILKQHYPLYDIDVQDVLVQWHPLDDTIILDLYSAKVSSLGGDEIAYLPQVQVGVKSSSILGDELDVLHVNIMDSRIRLARTAGGAIKFDIGNTDSGASGKILEYLLVDLAAAPGNVGDVRSFPTVSLVGGKLFLEDEAAGVSIRIPTIDLWLKPDDQGVASGVKLDIAAPGANVQLQADILYRTSDQVSVVDVSLDKFRPAVLPEMMPGFEYLEPFEVPISGYISGELNKFLELKTASFDLTGKNGSFEISDLIGYNPSVISVDMQGIYEGNSSSLKFENLHLEMENGVIDLSGVFAWRNEKIEILSRTLVSGISIFSLAPRLFSQFPPDILAAFDDGSSRYSKTIMTADGVYDPALGKFAGQGEISRESVLDVTTGENITEMTLLYRVDGPLLSIPNIAVEIQ